MRRLLKVAAVVAVLAQPGLAQDAIPANPDIQTTITAQMDAFQGDDFAQAFTYASPNIQGMFGSPERFGQMVQQGYPMVWRPSNVQYLNLRDEGGQLWQRVMVQDQSGTPYVLDYEMIEGPDGWLINGVQFVRQPQLGA